MPHPLILSHLYWRATATAFERTRVGTFNHFVLLRFKGKRGARPVDVVGSILDAWQAEHRPTWGKPRAYVQQRIYELGRRGVLEVRSEGTPPMWCCRLPSILVPVRDGRPAAP